VKRFSILGCIAAALLSFVGCEPTTGNEGYEGTNYIYLESDGGRTTIWEQDDAPLAVKVSLTTALEADLSLTFALEGTAGVLELKGNPVTIKAGEKTATVEIISLNAGKLEAKTNYTLTLDAANSLPEGVALKSGFQFAVTPELVADALTSDQKAIIEAYKKTSGVDLSKYIGYVNVSTVITGIDMDGELFEKNVNDGKTLVTLSENSTAEKPMLKMLANPMGVEDHFYSLLKAMTVENVEYWFPEMDESELPEGEVNPFACYTNLCEKISWNAESPEQFTMSLDSIVFDANKNIEFVHEVYNKHVDDKFAVVPFKYDFSAYNREIAAIAANEWDNTDAFPNCTADPTCHLNLTGILEDDWGGEDNIFVEPSAVITEDGKLVFTFCFDYYSAYAYDYTRVVATYTPNN
jgi:hypothetical protein